MPCEYKFIARVTMSTLPVRSPFPKRVPSTRSAPARSASSVSATPVPRSLWGWRLIVTCSRYFKFLSINSTWDAYTWGKLISTVTGRFIITLFVSEGSNTSRTALQTSKAYSGSAPVKLSGEYSNLKLPSYSAASFLTNLAPSIARVLISSFDFLNTCSRCATLTEL